MDIATDGPIGFWAVIYLAAALVARQIPGEMMQGVSGRLAALAGMVVVLFVLQVAIASLYRFEWVDWQGVIWGTGMAALGVLVVDLFWRGGGGERRLNVTERGARQAGRIG
jgi:rod shape-determining protein MreD